MGLVAGKEVYVIYICKIKSIITPSYDYILCSMIVAVSTSGIARNVNWGF